MTHIGTLRERLDKAGFFEAALTRRRSLFIDNASIVTISVLTNNAGIITHCNVSVYGVTLPVDCNMPFIKLEQ